MHTRLAIFVILATLVRSFHPQRSLLINSRPLNDEKANSRPLNDERACSRLYLNEKELSVSIYEDAETMRQLGDGRLPSRLTNLPLSNAILCDEDSCEVQNGMLDAFDFETETTSLQNYATTLSLLPILAPVVAFFTYDNVVCFYHDAIQLGRSWYSVDGGIAESQLLIPVVNGIILPSISIVLGTLVSSTLIDLRNRQVRIRECLNKEAADINTMSTIIDALYSRVEDDRENHQRLLYYLRQYTERLVLESRSIVTRSSQVTLAEAKTTMTEIDNLQTQLLKVRAHSGEEYERVKFRMADPFEWAIPNLLIGLNSQRSVRLSALLTNYPVQHWIIITLLYFGIVLCFLEESDGAALQFLGGVQLRLIFTILVGASSAISSLLFDLNDPFRGNFCIKQTIDGLYTLLEQIDTLILNFRPTATGHSRQSDLKNRK